MLSDLEIKHLLETACLPDRCVCILHPYGSTTFQIYDHSSKDLLLTVAGGFRMEVASSRSIVKLVGHIREEIRLRQLVGGRNTARQK